MPMHVRVERKSSGTLLPQRSFLLRAMSPPFLAPLGGGRVACHVPQAVLWVPEGDAPLSQVSCVVTLGRWVPRDRASHLRGANLHLSSVQSDPNNDLSGKTMLYSAKRSHRGVTGPGLFREDLLGHQPQSLLRSDWSFPYPGKDSHCGVAGISVDCRYEGLFCPLEMG